MDAEVVASARILAALSVRLTEAPEWWLGGGTHSDPNLLMAIYEQTDAIAQEHLKEVIKRGEAAKAQLQVGREDQPAPKRPQPTPVPSEGKPNSGW